MEAVREETTHFLQRRRPEFPNNPFVQQLQPAFDPHGGVGLYVLRGSASFRAVTMTPLAE